MSASTDPLATMRPITVMPLPSAPDFHRAHRRGRPLVLQQTPSAVSVDAIATRFADLRVSVLPLEGGRLRGDARRGTAFEVMRFGDALERMIGPDGPRWHVSTPLSDLPHEMREALPHASQLVAGVPLVRARLWVGATGTITPLHWDLPHNFLAPLSGARQVIVYPPLDGPWIGPSSPTSKMGNFARLNPEAPDARAFPLARFAHPHRTVLRPGDVLYLPPGWWHHVHTLETSWAINQWWADGRLSKMWHWVQAWKSLRGSFRGEWASPSQST